MKVTRFIKHGNVDDKRVASTECGIKAQPTEMKKDLDFNLSP